MSMIKLAVVAMTAFSVFAADSTRPGWIDGKAGPKWDRTRFVTAVGSGRNLEEASGSAKKALAEVFRAKVRSKHQSAASSSLHENTDGKIEGGTDSISGSNLEIETEIELKGAEIGESYKDGDTYYALSVLDKLKVRGVYSREAMKIKSAITSKLEQFGRSGSLAAGNGIVSLMARFDAINDEFSVVADGGALPPPMSSADFEALKAKMRDIGMKHVLFIDIVSAEDDFGPAVAACLTEKSLKVSTDPEEKQTAAYVAKGRLVAKDLPMNVEGWVKVQYLFSGSIMKKQKSIGRVSAKKTSSGRSKQMCYEKIKESLAVEVCEKLSKLVSL